MEKEVLKLLPYLIIDRENIIIQAGEKNIGIFNQNASNLINKKFTDFLKQESLEDFKNLINKNIFSDKNEFELLNNKTVKLNVIYKGESKLLLLEDITQLKIRELENLKINSLLENIFNLSSEAIRIIDTEYNVIKINDSYRHLHNLTDDEIIEEKCSNLLCFDICNTDNCVLKQILKNNEVFEHEVLLEKDGKKKYFRLNAKPYKVNNEILGVVESLSDITSSKIASEEILRQKNHIDLIINNIPPYISYINTDERYVFVNEQFANAFKLSKEEIIGKQIKEIYINDYHLIKPNIEEVLKGNKIEYNAEFYIPAFGNRWHKVTYVPDFDDEQKNRGFFVVTYDISDFKTIQKSLEESKEKYKLIANNTHDIIWTLDKNEKFLFISPSVESIRGFSQEEAMNQTLKEALCPEAYELARKEFNNSFFRINKGEKNIEPRKYIMKQPHKDGSILKMEIVVNTIFDEYGEFKYFIGVSRDISYRLEFVETIEQVDYLNLFKNINYGFALLEVKNNSEVYFIDVNAEFENIFKISRNILFNKSANNLFSDVDLSTFQGYLDNLSKSKKLSITYFYKPLQKYMDVFLYAPSFDKIAVIIRDITELQNIENTLKDNVERIKFVHKNLNDIIFALDAQKNITYINGAFEKQIKLTEKEIIGKNIFEFLTLATGNNNIAEIFKEPKEFSKDNEKKWNFHLNISGQKKHFETVAKPIFDNSGKYIGSAGITKEITEFVELLEKYESSQNVLLEIAKNTSDFYGKTDLEGNILYVSPSVEKVMGYKTEFVIGRNIFEFIEDEEIPKVKKVLGDLFSGKHITTSTHRIKRVNNEYVWLEVNSNLLFGSENKPVGLITSYRDISDRIKYEKAILEKEERLELLTQNISDVIYSIDKYMKYTYIAGNVEQVLGHKAEIFIGLSLNEVANILQISNYEIEKSKMRMKHVKLNKIEYLNYDVKIRRKSKIAYIENRAKMFFDKDGQICKINGVLRDITPRKYNEDRIHRLSLAVRQSPSSVVITDVEGYILFVNNKFCQITGYEREDVIRKHSRILKSGIHNNLFYKELWKTISAGNVWSGKLTNKKKDGTFFYEYAYIYPVKDENGEISSYIGLKEDITEKKNYEEILKRDHQKLQEANLILLEKNKEIDLQKQELVQLNETKDKFLSIIGHDLKNPIGSLYGFTNLLLSKFNDYDNEKRLYFVKTINEASKSTLDLIDKLFTWARAHTGKIDFCPRIADVSIIAKEVGNTLKTQAETKNIEILYDFDLECNAEVDVNMISTVIRNFVSNGIKFTNKGGIVKISITSIDKNLNINVIDNGVGMTEYDIEKLFHLDKSFSLPGTDDEHGTGLGLILCKEFIRKHNGKINVKSKVGEGSTFSFTIPKKLND